MALVLIEVGSIHLDIDIGELERCHNDVLLYRQGDEDDELLLQQHDQLSHDEVQAAHLGSAKSEESHHVLRRVECAVHELLEALITWVLMGMLPHPSLDLLDEFSCTSTLLVELLALFGLHVLQKVSQKPVVLEDLGKELAGAELEVFLALLRNNGGLSESFSEVILDSYLV